MIADDFARVLPAFLEAEDEAVIRLGPAQIDELLGSILRKRLPLAPAHLFEGSGLLASLAARIQLAHATGVIDAEFASTLYVAAEFGSGVWARRFIHGEWGVSQIPLFTAIFQRCGVPLYGPGRFKPEVGLRVLRTLFALLVTNLMQVHREVEPIESTRIHSLLDP